jgi:hypothetical protein
MLMIEGHGSRRAGAAKARVALSRIWPAEYDIISSANKEPPMQLTVDEKAAVRAGKPVRVREDDLDCVLIRADVFDRFEASVVGGEEFDVAAAYPLVNAAMADDDAQDPFLDSYEIYRR